jgi:hypothetical protein
MAMELSKQAFNYSCQFVWLADAREATKLSGAIDQLSRKIIQMS